MELAALVREQQQVKKFAYQDFKEINLKIKVTFHYIVLFLGLMLLCFILGLTVFYAHSGSVCDEFKKRL